MGLGHFKANISSRGFLLTLAYLLDKVVSGLFSIREIRLTHMAAIEVASFLRFLLLRWLVGWHGWALRSTELGLRCCVESCAASMSTSCRSEGVWCLTCSTAVDIIALCKCTGSLWWSRRMTSVPENPFLIRTSCHPSPIAEAPILDYPRFQATIRVGDRKRSQV